MNGKLKCVRWMLGLEVLLVTAYRLHPLRCVKGGMCNDKVEAGWANEWSRAGCGIFPRRVRSRYGEGR